MSKKINRFWEIDILRGIAIILMIIYHILYDLNYFNIYKTNFDTFFFEIYKYGAASIFVILVGVSLSLSYGRIRNKKNVKEVYFKFLKRGLSIFAMGLIITLVSLLYIPEGFIIFGILHFIGIAIILAIPFLKLNNFLLPLSLCFIFIGVLLNSFIVDFKWLLWLGLIPSNFFTVDYFPLLPWFGAVLLGIFVGKKLYPNHKRSFHLNDMSEHRSVKILSFLVRHSLIIYLIHQPIMLALIWLIF